MEHWLQQRIKDEMGNRIYKNVLPNYYYGKRPKEEFNKYYAKDDIDVQNTNQLVHLTKYIVKNDPDNIDEDTKELYEVLESYDDQDILITPNTNQSHANYIYKLIIDKSEQMAYDVPNVKQNGEISFVKIPIVSTGFKEKFYQYCFNNTSHT